MKGSVVLRILVTHIRNTYNYGSAMMAINLIYYLNKALGVNVKFYTDTRGEVNLLRLVDSTLVNSIFINEILPKRKRGYRFKVFKCFNDVNCNVGWVKSYAEGIANNYDALIVLGGDDLSEYYNKLSVFFEMYKIHLISKKIPVFLASQTIGPFTGIRKKAAKKYLKNSFIYARDLWTFNYLKKELGLNNIFSTADLAFLDLPRQQNDNETMDILNYYKLSKDSYITLVPSGLVKSYTNNIESYISTWRDILINLLCDPRLKGNKIVLLAHVLRSYSVDDRVIIKQILDQLDSSYRERIIPVYDNLLPYQARLILGNGLLTITGRMHAAISTFQMGKPAISLSYSIKYQGVIEETLGLKNLVIKTCPENLWELGAICDEVILKVDYVLKNYCEVKKEIENSVENCKEKALAQINHIVQRIKKDSQ